MKKSLSYSLVLIALFLISCTIQPNGSDVYRSVSQSGDDVSMLKVTPNGTGDNPSVVNTGYQFHPAVIRDKAGQYIVTWVDMRSGNFEVYGHKFYNNWSSYFGDMKMDDTRLEDGPADQNPRVAIDSRNNIYVLYAVKNGNLRLKKFTLNGARVTNVQADTALNPADWLNYDLAVDTSDNIYVVYQKPAANGGGSFISKFDSNCGLIWSDKNAGGLGGNPAIASAAGYVYIANAGGNITRIDADGNMVWKVTIDAPEKVRIAVETGGNVCAVYNFNSSIYYVKYGVNGDVVRAPTLVSVQGQIIENKDYADIAMDGANNKFIVYRDRYNTAPGRTGFDRTIRAQKLSASDTAAWTAGGVEVCQKDSLNQQPPAVCANGAGGLVAVWYDNREGISQAYIYGNEIAAAGTRKFAGDTRISGNNSSSSSSAMPIAIAGAGPLRMLVASSSSSSSSAYPNPDYAYAYGLSTEILSESVNWDVDTVFGIWTDYGAGAVIEPVTAAPYEAYNALKITGTGTWMGVSIGVKDTAVLKDLSAYAWGSLKFAYKGNKRFKVGIKSGGTIPSERWLTMTNGRYGFTTNNQWCFVSIPMSFFYGVKFDKIEQYLMIVSETNYSYVTGSVFQFDHMFYTTNRTAGGPVINTNINENNTIGIYSETVPITVNWDVDTVMEPWNTTTIVEDLTTAGEGSKSLRLAGVMSDWMGMGIRLNPATDVKNVPQYTNGSLKFRFRGTRPVKIGIKSSPNNIAWLNPAQLFRFGLQTNDSWCQVSIPMTAFIGIDFKAINYYFQIVADAPCLYSPGVNYYLDDLYWTTNTSPGGPTNVDDVNTFGLYSDTIPLDIYWDTDAKLDIWSDWGAGMILTNDIIDAPEGGISWKIIGTGTWVGMGLRVEPINVLKDLGAYSAGKMNFIYKGTKVFKVGIKSGGTTPVEKWLVMTNGQYGFATNNTWCSVTIPMSVFTGVNFGKIEQYFMFAADAPLKYTVGSVYRLDNIYFSK